MTPLDIRKGTQSTLLVLGRNHWSLMGRFAYIALIKVVYITPLERFNFLVTTFFDSLVGTKSFQMIKLFLMKLHSFLILFVLNYIILFDSIWINELIC